MISSSYDSGRISCTVTRSILADNTNEDRNLNENAYLLLAIGSQRGKALYTFIHTYTTAVEKFMVMYYACLPWGMFTSLVYVDVRTTHI